MSHRRMSASRVAHKSTGGTLQSLPAPVDPVGNAPGCLTSQTVAPPSTLQAEGYLVLEFYSGATGLSGRFTEGFSLRRLQPTD